MKTLIHKRLVLVAAFTGLALGLGVWRSEASTETDPVLVQTKGSLRLITLPEDPFELPAGPGKETVQAYCVTCHTPRYIVNQPGFSPDVWLAEVTKMRKAFSAPIPDDKVTEIVGYLTAVRGKPEKN